MSFETATDPSIRPVIGRQPSVAYGMASDGIQIASVARRDGPDGGHEVIEAGESEEFGFADLLDVVNPLQHIPVVSALYRELTGDEIKAPARILGGFLFGGPTGFASSIANAISVEMNGRDLGENVLAWVFGGDEAEPNVAATAAPETIDGPGAPAPAAALPAIPAAAVAASPGAVAAADQARGEAASGGIPEAPSNIVKVAAPSTAGPTTAAEAIAPQQAPLSGAAALRAFAKDFNGVTQPAAPAEPVLTQRARVPVNLRKLGTRDNRLPPSPVPSAIPQAPRPAAADATAKPAGQALALPTAASAGPRVSAAGPIDPALLAPAGPVVPGQAGGIPAAAASGDFSSQMLEALQKYQAMLKQREGLAGGR